MTPPDTDQEPLQPTPDHVLRKKIARLNTGWQVAGQKPTRKSMGRWLLYQVRRVLARVLGPQETFNAAIVDYINHKQEITPEELRSMYNTCLVGINDMHKEGITLHNDMQNMQKSFSEMQKSFDIYTNEIQQSIDETQQSIHETHRITNEAQLYREAIQARERRLDAATNTLVENHNELRTSHDELLRSIGALHQGMQILKQQVTSPSISPKRKTTPKKTAPESSNQALSNNQLDSYKYLGFEDQFRGSQEDIRDRLSEYLPVFANSSNVLDIGCGRGEFIDLLREKGISSSGVDSNLAMVKTCKEKGLDATEADALDYLRALPDGSLGGLLAAQVVEHLPPSYLMTLLDVAFLKLRSGAPIVLETINPACWFAFFESYIRDITHVRPLHPDTLKYLLVATGFHSVEIRYRAPYPDHDKLQTIKMGNATPTEKVWVETLNANVEKINNLLFTNLDYAAIGHRS